MKKFLSFVLVLCLVVSSVVSVNAATFVNRATYALSGNSQSGVYAAMALWTAANQERLFDITNSVWHTNGDATDYWCESTDTVTCNASQSITANYSTAFTSLANTLGVANSASASIRIGSKFTIPAENPTGMYFFKGIFTCYKVVEEVVESTSSGENVVWSNTINSAPRNAKGAIVLSR